jgi:hypothetical protein
MDSPQLDRKRILAAVKTALEPLDYTQAMWEAGAAAFERVDRWSDIDLMIDVDDDRVADVFAILESTLARLAPIELCYELPQPTWHGHTQRFYRLQGAGPFLVIDVAVIKHSNPNKFLQPEQHGEAVIHFDKTGVVQPPPFDWPAHTAMLRERAETLRLTFELFQALPLKELYRQNTIEAMAFYHSFILRPLVEVLRIRHRPARYNFYTRYIHSDLPLEVAGRLQELYFVASPDDLGMKIEAASAWFGQELNRIQPAAPARGDRNA